MKKTLLVLPLALALILACSLSAMAAEEDAAAWMKVDGITVTDQAYISNSGELEQMTALEINAEQFTAALAGAKDGDIIYVEKPDTKSSGYYLIKIRADLLEAAAQKNVWVFVYSEGDELSVARTIPSVAMNAQAIYPESDLKDLYVLYFVRTQVVNAVDEIFDTQYQTQFADANIKLLENQPLCSLNINLVKGDQQINLNSTNDFYTIYYYQKQPEFTTMAYTLDRQGFIRRTPEIHYTFSDGLFTNMHYYSGSHVEGYGKIGTMPQIADVADSWAEQYYNSAYTNGLLLNLPPEKLAANDKLTTEVMETVFLNLANVQAPSATELKLATNINQNRYAKIDTSTETGQQLYSIAVIFDQVYGYSAAALANFPAVDMSATVSRSLPLTTLYRVLAPSFDDPIHESEAQIILKDYRDGSKLSGELAVAWAYAIKHQWIDGDSQGYLHPYGGMTNAAFVKLLTCVSKDIYQSYDNVEPTAITTATAEQFQAALIGSWSQDVEISVATFTFNADGSGSYAVSGVGAVTLDMTYTIKDGLIEIITENIAGGEPIVNVYSGSISGDTLTLNDTAATDVEVYTKVK